MSSPAVFAVTQPPLVAGTNRAGRFAPLAVTYNGTLGAGPATIQVAHGAEGLTISINGGAAQPFSLGRGSHLPPGGARF